MTDVKKIILDFTILSLICSLLFVLFYLLFGAIGIWQNYLPFGLSFTFFLLGLSYKRLWSIKSFNSNKKRVIFFFLLTLLFSVNTYAFSLIWRSTELLQYLHQKNVRGWRGQAHRPDSLLGFSPLENARAFHTFPIGAELPMAFNSDGFRVPVSNPIETPDSVDIIFLGCSFTYGDATPAELTFSHLTAVGLNRSYINAGVCSYGLAQMVVLSKELLAKYKPKYVVLQHSPWLISRATSMYAPVYFGSLPTPYFVLDADSLKVKPPVYSTKIFSPGFDIIRERETSIKDYFRLAHFYLREDVKFIQTKVSMLFGKIEKPTEELEKAEILAYSSMIHVAKKFGTKVVILDLYDNRSFGLDSLINHEGVAYIDGDTFLMKYLDQSGSKDFNKTFAHWRFDGKDSICVDNHPNELAHKIISQALIEKMK